MKHIKQLYQAKQIIQAVHDNIYNSNEVSDIKYHDTESFRPIDEIASLLQAIHPQERVWSSPYIIEDHISEYLRENVPLDSHQKIYDIACGIYSKVCDAGGLRCEPEPLALVMQMGMCYSNSYYNGLTIFRS